VNIRQPRFLTAVIIVILSGFAVWRGIDIVRFKLALSAAAPQSDALQQWYSVPGVGTLAREAGLPDRLQAADKQELARERDALVGYLAVKPASSVQWLMLAAARLLLGESKDRVIAAYSLSVVTGPNENDVMVERAKFGLYLWDELPPDLKQREINDLSLGFFSGEEKEAVQKLLAGMSAASRDEIVRALPKTRRQAFGLDS